MDRLRITSCQALNTFAFTAVLADLLQTELGIPVEDVAHLSWADRYTAIDAGEIDLAWMCGWPFAHWNTWTDRPLKPIAAPIMNGARYDGAPVYFSDVIVRADSDYETLDDLRGSRFAYNYIESQSGYYVMCDRLKRDGEGASFFGDSLSTKAHLSSVAAVQDGRADTASIDSTLYDWLRQHRPEVTAQLRVVEELGPSPMPPIAARAGVPDEICQKGG